MKIKLKVILVLTVILIFSVITVIFALFDAGLSWDSLDNGFKWSVYVSMISYRILIYFAPALLIRLAFCFIKKEKQVSIVHLFTIQFVIYSIIKLAWEMFALDYILSTKIFDNIDSSIVIVGLLLSIIFKKKIKIDTDLIQD